MITRLNIGGPARHAIILSRRMQGDGFVSELVTGLEDEREGTLFQDGDGHVRVQTMKRSVDPLDDVRTFRELHRLVATRHPDIVHTHLAKAGTLGRVAAKRCRVPVIVHTFHGHVLDQYFSARATRLFTAIERRLAQWTDALVAVSPAVRDDLLGLGIGRADQWHVVPVGLELDHLLEDSVSMPEARSALGLPRHGPIVGIVGRLVRIKDHTTFLNAAQRVAAWHPDATFVVAGDGELRGSLEAPAKAMLGDRVTFLGWVTDLAKLYAALDVVVLTSRNEGTPVALIEAGAAAKPVVATDVGGVADVVRDGVTGTLVPRGDEPAVAHAISTQLGDPQMAYAMGAAGRAWVRGRFSADRLMQDMKSLYAELLRKRGVAQGE
jgi:glycosyltransferase involved in cell wall biosynthesis